MTDKEKIDTLIHHYIRSLDLSKIEESENIEAWALKFMISESIKGFIFPILDSGELKIK